MRPSHSNLRQPQPAKTAADGAHAAQRDARRAAERRHRRTGRARHRLGRRRAGLGRCTSLRRRRVRRAGARLRGAGAVVCLGGALCVSVCGCFGGEIVRLLKGTIWRRRPFGRRPSREHGSPPHKRRSFAPRLRRGLVFGGVVPHRGPRPPQARRRGHRPAAGAVCGRRPRGRRGRLSRKIAERKGHPSARRNYPTTRRPRHAPMRARRRHGRSVRREPLAARVVEAAARRA
mmetsp:Transcript_32649/g.112989  ORF Transcript_32649/g.112989 Transcript_32649/m.112989 type:complete len:232 (+) Transcript_32649:199-894(+)